MDIFVGLAYASGTRTVSIHELETEFSAPFRHVLSGEEIVILDHGREVARISPVDSDAADVIPAGDDAKLVASGATKLLQTEMDWDAFFVIDAGESISEEAIQEAIAWDRSGR